MNYIKKFFRWFWDIDTKCDDCKKPISKDKDEYWECLYEHPLCPDCARKYYDHPIHIDDWLKREREKLQSN